MSAPSVLPILRALSSHARSTAMVALETGRSYRSVQASLSAMASPRGSRGRPTVERFDRGDCWAYRLTDAGRERLRAADGEIGAAK